jgi:hypothetical protein
MRSAQLTPCPDVSVEEDLHAKVRRIRDDSRAGESFLQGLKPDDDVLIRGG